MLNIYKITCYMEDWLEDIEISVYETLDVKYVFALESEYLSFEIITSKTHEEIRDTLRGIMKVRVDIEGITKGESRLYDYLTRNRRSYV